MVMCSPAQAGCYLWWPRAIDCPRAPGRPWEEQWPQCWGGEALVPATHGLTGPPKHLTLRITGHLLPSTSYASKVLGAALGLAA